LFSFFVFTFEQSVNYCSYIFLILFKLAKKQKHTHMVHKVFINYEVCVSVKVWWQRESIINKMSESFEIISLAVH